MIIWAALSRVDDILQLIGTGTVIWWGAKGVIWTSKKLGRH